MGKTSTSSISLPEEIAKEVDLMARRENKTKSGFIQDALRSYIELRKWQELQLKISAQARRLKIESDEDIEKIVDEVRQ
jgi:metal-responsive CopG/Arc/MetJ family transcriptional regulator